jgi:hypothetical protein
MFLEVHEHVNEDRAYCSQRDVSCIRLAGPGRCLESFLGWPGSGCWPACTHWRYFARYRRRREVDEIEDEDWPP